MAPTEIMALSRILGELDYYQVLHLERGAGPRDIQRAFHQSARAFHPDANRHLDLDLQRAVSNVAKVITEAYQVLRDSRRRAAYDDALEKSGQTRIRLADAREAAATSRTARDARPWAGSTTTLPCST
jgi:DnaJ-class molecular chaperone